MRYVILFFTALSLGLIQVSFLVTWPEPISRLNLILSLVFFLTIVGRFNDGLWLAFGGGLLLELFSLQFFGLEATSMLLTVVIINFLYQNFFTNYSFFSVTILGSIGTVMYNLIVYVTNIFFYFLSRNPYFNPFDPRFIRYVLWELVLNLIILYVIFFMASILARRFNVRLSRTSSLIDHF